MDIVAETPHLRAMLDVRCYLSTLASGWRSARAHEVEKHQRYVTHCRNDDGNDVEQDGADQTDDVQPVEAAKPQKRYVPMRAEPAAAAPVRRRSDSVGDQGTQKAKEAKR